MKVHKCGHESPPLSEGGEIELDHIGVVTTLPRCAYRGGFRDKDGG
jgi:hypothetical protein